MAEDQGAAAKAALEADKKRQEDARKKVTEEREAREKAAKEAVPTAVKPTPTQEENDLAASGVHLPEKEPDGSPEDKLGIKTLDKEQKPGAAAPKSGYQTKQQTT